MPIKILKVDDFWIKIKDGDDEAEILIKPVHYDLYRRTIHKVAGESDDERWLKFCEMLATQVIIDWKGVLDEDGKEIPFDIDAAIRGFSDRVWSQIIAAALKEINNAEESFRGDKKATKVAKGKSKRVRRSNPRTG